MGGRERGREGEGEWGEGERGEREEGGGEREDKSLSSGLRCAH